MSFIILCVHFDVHCNMEMNSASLLCIFIIFSPVVIHEIGISSPART
jgi:hypothetical protein